MASRAPRRSIDELFGQTPRAGVEDLANARMIDVGLIDPNPFQPRTTFDEGALADLAASLRAHGVRQPLQVREAAGGRYQIVAGERRLRAARLAELPAVPALIGDVSDDEMEILAIIENVQREDLQPLDEAHAYQRLINRSGLSLRAVAERVGKSHEHVARRLSMISNPRVEKLIQAGAIGPSVGAALARIDDKERQAALLTRAEGGEQLSMKDLTPAAGRPAVHRPEATPVPNDETSVPAPRSPGSAQRGGRSEETPVTIVTPPEAAATPQARSAPTRDVAPRHDDVIAEDTLTVVRLLRAGGGKASRARVRQALQEDLAALREH